MNFLLSNMAMEYKIYYLRKRVNNTSVAHYCVTCYVGWVYCHPVSYIEGIAQLKAYE